MKRKYNIAVIGASGMVGGELLFLLEKRKFPINEIKMFSSGRKKYYVNFKNRKYLCQKPSIDELKKMDIVFFVSNEEISAELAPELKKLGIWCIDDSAKFRYDENVPLIIPEINAHLIKPENKLIAGPNCTLTPLAVSCYNVHKKFHIEEIRLSTYQAVSGAGKRALKQLFEEVNYFARSSKMLLNHKKVLPQNIAFNVFPQVGNFDNNGISGEEKKVEIELKKIWDSPEIKISVNAVRVPTIRVHCLSAWIRTRKKWQLKDIENTIKNSPGVEFMKDKYSTPLNTEKKFNVTASRLRKTAVDNEFLIWLCGDNLYKGAALNSIQIAENIIALTEKNKFLSKVV